MLKQINFETFGYGQLIKKETKKKVIFRVASLPGILEKPGKTWKLGNFEKNLEKPGILKNFNMFSS